MKTVKLLIISIIFCSLYGYNSFAQKSVKDSLIMVVDTLTNSYLDTLNINKKIPINNYNMIGIYYGGALNNTMFNPVKHQKQMPTYNNIGIMFTHYTTWFNYMPYFGYQVGVFIGKEGYMFKADNEGLINHVDGATKTTYNYIEIPFMTHCHVDFWKIKLMANFGLYGGYRLNVHRLGNKVPQQYINNFYPYDIRIDYGIQGGVGAGLILSPFEIHFNAYLKQSLSSLYKPDYNSKYYYHFAYPQSVIFTVSLHYQLTKRTGKTRKQIKQEAYNAVYKQLPQKEITIN